MSRKVRETARKRRGNGGDLPVTPFEIGQTADYVLRIAGESTREHVKDRMVFVRAEKDHEGETVRFRRDGPRYEAQPIPSKEIGSRTPKGMKEHNFIRQCAVRWFFVDCSLTFEVIGGKGPFRVVRIGPPE